MKLVYATVYRDGFYPDDVLYIFSTEEGAENARQHLIKKALKEYEHYCLNVMRDPSLLGKMTYEGDYVVIEYELDRGPVGTTEALGS